MLVLRVFATEAEAERASGWLRRSGLRPSLSSLDDGRVAVVVPADEQVRAEGVLQAVVGVPRLEALDRPRWWRRVFVWENLAVLVAAAVFGCLEALVWDSWVRLLGLAGFLLFLRLLVCGPPEYLGPPFLEPVPAGGARP